MNIVTGHCPKCIQRYDFLNDAVMILTCLVSQHLHVETNCIWEEAVLRTNGMLGSTGMTNEIDSYVCK